MKKFDGFDEAKSNAKYSGGGRLPAGAYVCKVLGVKYEEQPDKESDRIIIQFDIAEGDYNGFFTEQYQKNTKEDKKYKGKTTIYAPNDNTKDQWRKDSFAKWTNAFEDSNPGYAWDWDEKKWKGKLVGIVFGDTGTKINGNDIVYTEARFPCAADDVRNGVAPEAKFKAKNGYGESAPTDSGNGTDFMSVPDNIEEDLPWN